MIYLILLLGFWLRLVAINQSMWLDESISANVAKMAIEKIIPVFSVNDFHPPLYYLFLNLWIKIFGDQVVWMRLSSVLFSLVTIWLVYKIGQTLKDKKTGLWAAVLVGVNPLIIYYAQELRMYSMTTMLLTGAVYFWSRIITSKEIKKIWWFSFNLMIFLAFLTFYGSVFFSAALILHLVWKNKGKGILSSSWGLVIAIVLIGPLLKTQLLMSRSMLGEIVNWSLVLGKVELKNLLLIPIKFCIGRVSWYPRNWYYLISGLWTFLVWLVVIRNGWKNKKLLWLIVAPLAMALVFSIKSPMMQYFRFLYLVPIMALLLAETKNKFIKIFFVLGFLGFSGFYLLNENMHREDWKSVASDLNNQPVYMIGSFGDPIRYYDSKIEIRDIKTVKPTEKEIRVIPYGELIHGVDSNKLLTDLGYKIVEKKSFREVVVEKWEKSKN